jgi:hypothetical protein
MKRKMIKHLELPNLKNQPQYQKLMKSKIKSNEQFKVSNKNKISVKSKAILLLSTALQIVN